MFIVGYIPLLSQDFLNAQCLMKLKFSSLSARSIYYSWSYLNVGICVLWFFCSLFLGLVLYKPTLTSKHSAEYPKDALFSSLELF